MSWIAVVGWDRLTHSDATRGRGPLPWHRTYAELLDDEGYWELSGAARGVFHGVLLVTLKCAGRCPTSTLTLSRKTGLKVRQSHLDSLVQAGLIGVCASTEQAARLHAASPRARREELEKYLKPAEQSRSKGTPRPSEQDTNSTNDREPASVPFDLDAILPTILKDMPD
jgi:hypothetical protein